MNEARICDKIHLLTKNVIQSIKVNTVKEKINQFTETHRKAVIGGTVAFAAVVVTVMILLFGGVFRGGNGTSDETTAPASRVNPSAASIAGSQYGTTIPMLPSTVQPTTAKNRTSTTAPTAATRATRATSATRATTATRATSATRRQSSANLPFATAAPAAEPADYSAQWSQGYLVAIDNPDPGYACSPVSLTDEDRDLLERLCMGEFGGGGFVGAALIAQSVKDAMYFDGIGSVAQVIRDYHYDGSTEIGTNDDCRAAVRYIFDENQDAVQHRILYMYNPYMVGSDFHESQEFVLSYGDVRFFDR